MRHWLRRMNPQFQQTPHLMLVDEGRLMELIGFLQTGDVDLRHSAYRLQIFTLTALEILHILMRIFLI